MKPMSIPTEINGTTTIKGKNIIFAYKDGNLSIYLLDEYDAIADLLGETYDQYGRIFNEVLRPLLKDHLTGRDARNCQEVHFYFQPDNYTLNYSSGPTEYTTLIISVDKFIIYEVEIPERVSDSLSFSSEQFHHFLSMIPKVSEIDKTRLEFSVCYDFPSTKMTANFLLNGKKIAFKPSTLTTVRYSYLEFTPRLSVRFEELDVAGMLELCDSVLRFLRFAFMRNDIFPDEINFVLDGCAGHIYYPQHQSFEYEPENLASIRNIGCLRWKSIYKNMDKLFPLIHNKLAYSKSTSKKSNPNKPLYLLHLPETKEKRYEFTINDISQISAAFESEFGSLYPKFTPSPEMENGKLVQKPKATFRRKLKYALTNNANALKGIRRKTNSLINDDEIADICVEFRNAVDHGRPLPKKSKKEDGVFRIFNCLVYALQLSRAGYSQKEIDPLLPRLYDK